MKPILRGLFVLLFLFVCVAASALEPANPNANAKAKAILNYLQSLSARQDKRLLSGQFAGTGRRTNLRLMDQIHEPAGQWPSLVGADYADFANGSLTSKAPNQAVIKPFGFTEYGPHGSSNPPGDYDYRRFLEGVKKDFPKAVFFMSWDGKWSLARNNNVKELLADPWIVNRADLPAGLTGAGK